jgi:hypothetical protein
VIYGLAAGTPLHGNEAADDLVGGIENDTPFGDGSVPTLFDTNDKLKSGRATMSCSAAMGRRHARQ